MDVMVFLLCLVAILAVVQGIHQPCPRHCRCTAAPRLQPRHHWHRLLAKYRMQRLVYGYRNAGKNFHIRKASEESGGREMTCLGLKKMPSYVPTDVAKLTFYGDKRGTIYQQDQSAGYFSDEPSGPPTQKSDLRLTQINKYAFGQSNTIKELSIEGNKLKVIHPNELEVLRSLKKLHMRNNNIKVMMPESLNGLVHLEELDLSNNRIRRVARNIFEDTPLLKKLHLQENKLKKLNKKTFKKLKDLQIIDLSNNKLSDMHKDIFNGMLSLKEIVLDNNLLTKLRPEWFFHTNNLQRLSVKGNELTHLSPETFLGLHSLKYLFLHKNKIDTVPKNVFEKLNILLRLDLSHNAIKRVEANSFYGLQKLHTLNLAHNKIEDLTNGTLNGLYNLVDLFLSNNLMYEIKQPVFQHLRRVQRLDVSHNKLKILRYRNFFGMLDLREVKLDHNNIKSIDNEAFAVSIVHTYTKLTWLYLNQNKVYSISPKTLQGLHYLKFLNLGSNDIYDVHESAFTNLKRLSTLLLYDNQIGYLKAGQFKHLNLLHHLNLAENSIKDISFSAFKGLKMVEDINLEGNEIATVSPESILDTPHLVSLNLKHNDLKQVDLKILDASNRLRYLDLAKNRISHVSMPTMYEGRLFYLSLYDNYLTSLSEEIIRTLNYGGSLHLYGNPWSCNCKLSWIQKYAGSAQLRLADGDDIVCKSPPSLAGEQILSLEPEDMTCGPVADVPHTSPLTCDFMSNIHKDNKRDRIKAQKTDIYEWITTFYDSNHRTVCTGTLIAKNTVLTHSQCWKNELDLSNINATLGEGSGDERDDIMLDRVLYYPGGLDIALVKLRADAERFRVFPCLLSDSGITESKTEGAVGLVPARVAWEKPRARVKLNAFPFKALAKKSCSNNDMCIRGYIRDIKTGSYFADGHPFLLKVGRSKWALAGITMDKDSTNNTRIVHPIYPAVNWINTLV